MCGVVSGKFVDQDGSREVVERWAVVGLSC